MEYTIKQVPEDFVVREIMEPTLGEGRFACYKLSKRGWTTQSAVNQVSRAFGKRPKFINFSGNKDKQAVTEQHISILHGPSKSLELQGGDIKLEFLGRIRERINLGTSPGNWFGITVRNLPQDFTPRPVSQVPNYFDKQRFGMNLNNHVVGGHLVRGEFSEACELVPETRAWLDKSPRDYVGALRSLPKRILRIYAHAYQSWLWNRTASSVLEKSPHRKIPWSLGELIIPESETDSMKIPILGYSSEIPPKLRGIIKGILKEEGISLEDFRVKQFREFDLSGNERDLLVAPTELEIDPLQDDDLNPGKKKCLVRFSLQKGSYATMVIRAIFSQPLAS